MENDEKTCRVCKRVLIGESKLGLCPDCLNKYGTIAAVFSTGGLAFGIKYAVKFVGKNSDKIGKVVVTGIKRILG